MFDMEWQDRMGDIVVPPEAMATDRLCYIFEKHFEDDRYWPDLRAAIMEHAATGWRILDDYRPRD